MKPSILKSTQKVNSCLYKFTTKQPLTSNVGL